MLSNLATIGLTVLALNVSPQQYCNDQVILAEQLQRYRQYGEIVNYFPESLFRFTSNSRLNYSVISSLIRFAMAYPKKNSIQQKEAAIVDFMTRVNAICQKNIM